MEKDPYKYFRVEARELLESLGRGVIALEKGVASKESIAHLLRFAHTLKGAARVVKKAVISELAHAVEEALAPYREGGLEVPKDVIDRILKLLDSASMNLVGLQDPAIATEHAPAMPVTDARFQTVRVDISEVDSFLEDVAEAAVQLAAFRQESDSIKSAKQLAETLLEQIRVSNGKHVSGNGRNKAEELRDLLRTLDRNFSTSIERQQREFEQVREKANQLRLLPAEAIFPALERAARDAAGTLKKNIQIDMVGGEIRLDAHVLSSLRDALGHIVRNAVDHGIEPEMERIAAGKELQGRIRVQVERRGSRVAFMCRDDGRGIDVEAIRRTAKTRGLAPGKSLDSMNLDEAVRLLLGGGLSTRGEITEVSGRGIGLDIVRETAARLKGDVQVQSQSGRGTTIEICVPITLALLNALSAEAGGSGVCLPLDAVRSVIQLKQEDIARSPQGDSILFEGMAIPLIFLAESFQEGSVARKSAYSAIIIQVGNGRAALGVDRLHGAGNVMMRPLPPLCVADSIIAGAALDVEGNPRLVLDPAALIDVARLSKGRAAESVAARHLPILVIDDSLTTRMLEQSILESAGYEVDLAISGEEALEKARVQKYALFIVDVEMPGMSGFEFIEKSCADASLNDVPAILVTSRDAPEDRLRGQQVGARAYIVKGQFDQGRLLQTIAELMG
jgi:two-component system chemotaxis sensor kinase CheA